MGQGGFPIIAEITHCHTFTKEINHASSRSQYFNENFYCKNCLRVFSAMTGKPALDLRSEVFDEIYLFLLVSLSFCQFTTLLHARRTDFRKVIIH